ncbi:hypothetical protein HPB47_005689 [Ixodes persulcatus]|uniref:Uncharacterized protein n=1 Tax=Ixodes persulcatus TaxID=34615 RepID=A0AC60PC91_IXOPE|nr:hypothetical protein HPB47_005689 [Ixodes persulcatus]
MKSFSPESVLSQVKAPLQDVPLFKLFKGDMFTFNAYDDRRVPHDERRILTQLIRVVETSPEKDVGVGILTAQDRDAWAEAYGRLVQTVTKNAMPVRFCSQCEQNAASLEAIKKAAVVVCLDGELADTEPYEVAWPRQVYRGGANADHAANRWWDKPVQIVVGEDGGSALLLDHTDCDGTVMTGVANHCYNYASKTGSFEASEDNAEGVPQKLEFVLGPDTLIDIEKAKAFHMSNSDNTERLMYQFPNYGKKLVQSCNLSPDGYVQMAMQLAAYSLRHDRIEAIKPRQKCMDMAPVVLVRLLRTAEPKTRKEHTIFADLQRNGYTSSFIRRIARHQARDRRHLQLPANTQTRPTSRISVPYIKGTSEALARVLAKEGIQVAHKPMSTLGRLMPRPKDRPPKERAQGVIYKLPCADCPVAYIGETKNFQERIRQHKNDVRKFDHERSAVAEHCDVKDHIIDFANTSILAVETHPRHRLFIESWHIQTTPGNINRSLGTLPTVYVNGLRHLIDAKR